MNSSPTIPVLNGKRKLTSSKDMPLFYRDVWMERAYYPVIASWPRGQRAVERYHYLHLELASREVVEALQARGWRVDGKLALR